MTFESRSRYTFYVWSKGHLCHVQSKYQFLVVLCISQIDSSYHSFWAYRIQIKERAVDESHPFSSLHMRLLLGWFSVMSVTRAYSYRTRIFPHSLFQEVRVKLWEILSPFSPHPMFQYSFYVDFLSPLHSCVSLPRTHLTIVGHFPSHFLSLTLLPQNTSIKWIVDQINLLPSSRLLAVYRFDFRHTPTHKHSHIHTRSIWTIYILASVCRQWNWGSK